MYLSWADYKVWIPTLASKCRHIVMLVLVSKSTACSLGLRAVGVTGKATASRGHDDSAQLPRVRRVADTRPRQSMRLLDGIYLD